MANVVGQLNTGLAGDALWGAIAPAMPLVIGLTLFALGYYLVKKNVTKARKGKSGM